MNTRTVILSSNDTNVTTNYQQLSLMDYTSVTYNLSAVSEKLIPTHLKISWGDGKTDFYDNDLYTNEDLISDKYSSIFASEYQHEYYPSNTTTTKNLTSTFTVGYINGDESTFNIPIFITNYDYLSSIEDLYLINTTILPKEKIEKVHQFATKRGGYLVELITSR